MSLLKGWVIRIDGYGYYTGKSYRCDGEWFPVCETKITENTKIYTSPIRAANTLKKLLLKIVFPTSGEVQQLKEGDLDA